MNRIKVMIIDDSAVVRQVMTGVLGADPGVEVIGAVADPLFAMERMKRQWPDVILLDVEMPRMDGITFLRKIMSERPTPVVICSTLTEAGAATTLEALAAGAVTTITKPKVGLKEFLHDASSELTNAIRVAAKANLRRRAAGAVGAAGSAGARSSGGAGAPVGAAGVGGAAAGAGGARSAIGLGGVPTKNSADVILAPTRDKAMTRTTERVVAIGTSTGGTQALEHVLAQLPAVCPGIVIVQHMPPAFTGAFASRLNNLCAIEVREAKNNDRVIPGTALIAPGGKHLLLKRSGAQYYVEVKEGPPVNRHCPSVDVLFRSAATCAGSNALGIIMTGMGDDGARGLKEMRDAGAHTIAQDEASCVVFGMPKEAIRLDAAERVMSLDEVPRAILHAA
jgi:two-component system, chemotaxis family, protein-glutamate methylesterase/glutaminase